MADSIPQPVGLVLAGGRGTRLGSQAKGMVTAQGRPLISYATDLLVQSCASVGINTIADLKASYETLPFPLVLDDPDFADRGPLVGILAGLEWAAAQGATTLLTAPCDAPLLPQVLGAALLAKLDGNADAVIAATPNGLHPLCAAWKTSLAPKLRAHLSDPQPKLAVRAFLSTIPTTQVQFSNEHEFHNVNTAEDLRTAEQLLAAKAKL